MQILMPPGQSYCALAILLAIVGFQRGGCLHATSSASQKGGQLVFTCTVWHKRGEAEGLILFWCKDRPSDCSPETSLEQLRVKRDPGTGGSSEQQSQLVFTIEQATPSDSGTYQCCARSRKPDIYIHGHFVTVLVTDFQEVLLSRDNRFSALTQRGSDRRSNSIPAPKGTTLR